MPLESLSNPFGSFRMGLYPPGGAVACNYTTYFDGTNYYQIPFVEAPQITSLNGVNVVGGAIPKFNTTGNINVVWTAEGGNEVLDTDPTTPHENATIVDVVRSTQIAQYSHKDGIPVATLLYYRDDLNVRVDFNGTFVIPETVTSPVTFGWGVTNGNVVGEVEQAEFDQVVTTGLNDIIMLPEFTDDWGNTIGLSGRTVVAAYGDAPTFTTTYISDLIPTSSAVGFGSLMKDLTVDGNPLTMEGVVYTKGWGAHASGYVEHDISSGYDDFQMVFGWDDEAPPPGSGSRQDLNMIIDLDGVQHSTDLLAGWLGLPITKDISVVGKSTLRITFQSVGNNSYQHVDLADAKLIKNI